MSDGPRSFDAAIQRRAKELVAEEARRRASEFDAATAEQLQVLEYAAKDKAAEIHWTATEHRQALDQVAAARSEELEAVSARIQSIANVVTGALQELEQTATKEAKRLAESAAASRDDMRRSAAEEAAAFDDLIGNRLAELEGTLRAHFETFRSDLAGESRRLEEQAAATGDDVRRVAAEQANAFNELAGKRAAELQAVVRNQTELLGEFKRLQGSTTDHLDEVRVLATDLKEETQDRLAELDAAGKRQIFAIADSVTAAAEELREASTSEVQRIEERATAFEEQVDARVAEFRHLGAQLSGLEGSPAGLQELDRHLESRWREIEALIDERLAELHTQDVDGRLEQAVASATAEFDAVVTARTRHFEASAEDVRTAARDDIVSELKRAEAALAHAKTTQTAELGEMISAARAMFEQVASSRIEGIESIAAELRGGLEQLHDDITAALQESGEAQSAALDRAAMSWLARIDRAGRKRGRTGWRGRTAPSATAVILAIAAAVGGTLMVRGGGNDRSNVADASAPRRSGPAAAANVSTTTSTLPATDAQPQPDAIHWTAPGQPQPQQQGQAPGGGGAQPATGAPGSGLAAASPAAPQPQQQSPPTSPAPPAPPPQEQPPPPPPQQPSGPLDFLNPALSAPGELIDGLL
jgi:hypothetical protein